MRHPHRLIPPLVAIGHGSRDPRAAAAVTGLLALARERAAARGLAGIDIRAAFLDHAAPAPSQVLDALAGELAGDRARDGGASAGEPGRAAGGSRPGQRGPRGPGRSVPRIGTVVLPLLLTAAYHSGTDIPRRLAGAADRWPGLRISYGAPLGPHPGLLRALEARLAEAGVDADRDARHTAVVLVSAGSSQAAASAVIAGMAAGWQASRGWQAVVPAYASAARPAPAEAVQALRRDGARRVVVASYLLAPGLFADRAADAARAAGAAAVAAPLGAAGDVADVLLDRYAAALGSRRAVPAFQPAAWV